MFVSGTIRAVGGGGSGNGGGGSGGAIRLVSPIITGSGTLSATGGSGGCISGGAGRVRVDALDTLGFSLSIQGSGSIGSNMFVFPPTLPRLDLIEVGGQEIEEGEQEAVVLLLPFGGSTSQTVTVQARDFSGIVPITVALIPDNGDRQFVDAEIDMSEGNPASVVVPIELTDSATHIQVWTR
jgi:hypothetical protein